MSSVTGIGNTSTVDLLLGISVQTWMSRYFHRRIRILGDFMAAKSSKLLIRQQDHRSAFPPIFYNLWCSFKILNITE
jgi:hypothetical protein